MKLIYKIDKGIGVLQNPQQLDISMCNKIDFEIIGAKNAILEINNITKLALNENCNASVSVKTLKKGTNTLRVIQYTNDGAKIYPCQPFAIFNYNDKLYSSLATSLDIIELINKLQNKCIELELRIKEIERSDPHTTKTKANELVDVVNNIQYRLAELEKGYDPTI